MSADGTYVILRGRSSATAAEFAQRLDRTPDTKISDEEILAGVEFLQPTDSRLSFLGEQREAVLEAQRRGLFKVAFARWPDATLCVLCYPTSKQRPQDHQLIRAYRNSRRVAEAMGGK